MKWNENKIIKNKLETRNSGTVRIKANTYRKWYDITSVCSAYKFEISGVYPKPPEQHHTTHQQDNEIQTHIHKV